MANAVVRIAPNSQLFDLPVLVGIEEGLFAKAGLDVSLSQTYADRAPTLEPREALERQMTQRSAWMTALVSDEGQRPAQS